ncbi:MAG: hypothetical protein ACRCY8_13530, partial [Dermatophilaceae bacterium]
MRSSPRRRIAGLHVVAGAAVVAVLVACTGADAARRPASPGGPSAGSGQGLASAVDELLARRADAVVSGDIEAFRDTVADPEDADGRRQLAAFASASALGVARFVHEPVSSATDAADATDATDLVVRVA